MNPGRRGTTRVSGPGQNRAARCRGGRPERAGDQGHLFGSGDQHGQRHVGRGGPSVRTGGPPPRAGPGRRPARRRCRSARPPRRRRPVRPRRGARRRLPRRQQPAAHRYGHQHAQSTGEVAGRAHPCEAGTAGRVDRAVGLCGGQLHHQRARRAQPAGRAGHDRLDVGHAGHPETPRGATRAATGSQSRTSGSRSANSSADTYGGIGHHQVHPAGQAVRQGGEPRALRRWSPGRPRPGRPPPERRGWPGPRPSASAASGRSPRPRAGGPAGARTLDAPATGRWRPSRSRGPRRRAGPSPGPRPAAIRAQLGQGHLHHLLGLGPGDQHPAVHGAARAGGTARCRARTAAARPSCGVRRARGPPPAPPEGHPPGRSARRRAVACSTIQAASRVEPTRAVHLGHQAVRPAVRRVRPPRSRGGRGRRCGDAVGLPGHDVLSRRPAAGTACRP